MAVEKIYKKINGKLEDTGFQFVVNEGTSFWGINDKGEYRAFSRKYYVIKKADDIRKPLDDFWY